MQQISNYSSPASVGSSSSKVFALASALAVPFLVVQATQGCRANNVVVESTAIPYSSLAPRFVTLGNSDLLNSTAIYVLAKLHALERDYPRMKANVDDARVFAKSLPFDVRRPDVWTDDDTEVAFEWKRATIHALVSFEGDRSFGYAMRRGKRFVPGSFPGDLTAGVPRDLLNYLKG